LPSQFILAAAQIRCSSACARRQKSRRPQTEEIFSFVLPIWQVKIQAFIQGTADAIRPKK